MRPTVRFLRRRLAAFLPLLLLWPAALRGAEPVLPTASAVPGGVAVLRIAEPGSPRPQAWFQGRPVLVVERGPGWQAVVGLPLALKPGPQVLEIADGSGARHTASFEVRDKHYPVQQVHIKDRRKVTPEREDLLRIEREQAVIAAVKSLWRDEPRVDLALRLPADGALSSRFGLRRIFNGEPRQPHSGLDLAVASGTPVLSSGAGRVADTGDYFFNGKTVFVDHGQGLITMYCHLSRIDVAVGDAVAPGRKLGLSGMSGRASGPHLHWSVMLNATPVDPELFLAAGLQRD